jgi:general secretion pathway protein K
VVPQLEGFRRLSALVGVPGDTADRITQALQGVAAAQTADAQGGPPLRPTRLADMAWLGIDKATLDRLAPYVDLLPVATPVNANTAPREVLVAALDIDAGTAERLVQARGREAFKSMAAVAAQLPQGVQMDPARVAVGSSYFRVSGRLRLDERLLEERSLLVRRDNRVEVLQRERQSFSALPR